MAATEEQQKEAKLLGWSPKESWRGDPAHWVDADVFVERGKTVLPIVKENNERLTSTVNAQQAEIDRLKGLVEAGQASMEEFKKFHGEELRRQVDKTKRDLRIEIEQARKDGDVETAVDLQEKLDDLNESTRGMAAGKEGEGKAEGKGTTAAPGTSPTKPQPHPDFAGWHSSNPWYGQDPVKTSLANGIAVKMRQEGSTLVGKAFYDAVGAAVENTLNPPGPGTSKVEGGGNGGGGGGGGGSGEKGFDNLPAEAKAYATSVAKKYVGEGKMFKTEADWYKYYADHYEV